MKLAMGKNLLGKVPRAISHLPPEWMDTVSRMMIEFKNSGKGSRNGLSPARLPQSTNARL
jgi:hypothetical protein